MKTYTARHVDDDCNYSVQVERQTAIKKIEKRLGEERRTSAEASTELLWMCGGLVDLQINGFNGVDFADPQLSVDQVEAFCLLQASFGVTHFLATITTASNSSLLSSLRNLIRLKQQSDLLDRMMLGIHLEGPYISMEDGPRGAHPLEHCRPPSLDEFRQLQESADGLITILTLSPEYEKSSSLIQAVANQVIVSIGHTAASTEQIKQAVDAGASMSTHLGNGMHKEVTRHPNYIWEQLADDRLAAGLIGDGIHLDLSTLKVFLRAKTPDRCFLVSDATVMSGKPPGIYGNTTLGDVEITEDYRLVIPGQRKLNAGAYLSLNQSVSRLAKSRLLPRNQIVSLASSNPVRILNERLLTISSEKQESSFVLFHWGKDGQFETVLTVNAGKVIYSS